MRSFVTVALFATTLFAAGALGACSGGPPPAEAPKPADHAALGLAEPAGTLVWRGLDALGSARITLPLPTAAEAQGTFPLDGTWTLEPRTHGRLRVYSYPLPFLNDMPRPNYAPMGARLFRGGAEVPFVNDPQDLRGGGWFVERDRLQVLAMESPEKWREAPRLEVPELAAAVTARTWSGAGAPADFVRTEVTVAGVTRPGLQLPPGSEVTFDVAIPADATLDFGRVRLPALLPGDEGGAVSLAWAIDGEALDDATAEPGVVPAGTRVDLGKWAGRTVALSFRAPADNRGTVVVTAPTVSRATGRAPRRVVLVGIDTLRQDALGTHGYDRATSPVLDGWAKQSVVFDNAWAPAPRTRPSFRTALTGRYPLAATDAPTVAETLTAEGFRTAGVVANVHLVPRFGFNDGFEHWHYENGAIAEVQIERALAWLEAHRDEDTFLFLHLMDPHTFYNAPEPYGARFQTGARPEAVPELFDRWHVYRLMEMPTFGKAEKDWIRGAYDGEVAYTTDVLARFFAAVDALPGRTLSVVHSDHGEEMWDHGAFEHNHSLYDELVRVVLWFRAPGGQSAPPRVTAPAGLVDIVPTILDLLGVRAKATDGRSLAAYVDPARAADRPALDAALAPRPLAIGHLMFDKERWAVVADHWKYILHTGSGEEELYDLGADPKELDDRSESAPPERLARMRAAMQEAFGWPVRPGWRVRFEGPNFPVVLTFAAPIANAGLIDPEAERSTRANLEWGEHPLVDVAEVGEVRLGTDRTTVTFVPGPKADGRRFWVTCEGPCPAATVRVGETELPLAAPLIEAGAVRLETQLGTVMEVPVNLEAPRAAGASEEMQALEALGYVAPD